MDNNHLHIDASVTTQMLIKFLQLEFKKAGFSKAILGLSGGIDSALACYLAVAAFGAENVMVVRMPYRASSPESLEHANLIIDDLRLPNETVDISGMVDALCAISPDMTPHRKGNIMARARMTAVYDRSMGWNGLVIGTSNKTELLLGYGTIFGDLASAVNPIGDLYKTQVRQLSHHVGVPAVIIDKPPSADLIPGQTDEGDFGFSYADVDNLLHYMVDKQLARTELVQKGFAEPFIDNVTGMISRAQYKGALPIIAKLS